MWSTKELGMIGFVFAKIIRKICGVCVIRNSYLHRTARVANNVACYHTIIDKYSYLGDNSSVSHSEIGAYTSIAGGCRIGSGTHPLNWGSTSPAFYNGRNIFKKNFSRNVYNEYAQTKIGNDVWIGAGVQIKGGVTIGDGAIIGMGAVVTKDIPPYEVWAGVPAKFVKKRFEDEVCEELLRKKWWNWSDEKIVKYADSMNNINQFVESIKEEKTKVVHLCLGCFFPDNYAYQENLLPKYHSKNGNKVEVIASLQTFDKNGKPAYMNRKSVYINEHGLKVTRLDYLFNNKVFQKLKIYKGVEKALQAAKPDILFIHGCQFLDIRQVVKYLKKHQNVKVFVDNHADFSNSATNWFSKNVLHKIIWKYCAKVIEPYTKKFYGVLPARVDFLANVYGLPKEKIELLVMGADDEKVEEAKQPEIRKEIRERYGIADDDFLIMTGGKIDLFKTQTLLLMEAVNKINNPKVKLIVFGSVVPELKEKIAALCSERVQYIGWVQAVESYKYFAACDLVVFPGRHSVFWEQVAGQAKPLIVKYWEGTTHVDLEGNAEFLYKDSIEEITEKINKAIANIDDMEKKASEKAHLFMYSDIAKRSIN